MIVRILIDNVSKDHLIPEWGLAVFIEYNGHKILLDTGATGKFIDNAASMGLDISQVEFGVLSHAHYDHSDGMACFFQRNEKAPFYLRDGSKENCYGKKLLENHYIGIHKGFLEAYKDRIIYVKGDYKVIPGVELIPHKTQGLELLGEKAGMYVEENGELNPDSFAHEQSLVFHTEKGMVIFNSCSHGGADNIIQEIADTYPKERIYALIGGLHLFESSHEEVSSLAKRLRNTGVEKIYTGHCTGDKALGILKEELGDRVEEIYTGMTIII